MKKKRRKQMKAIRRKVKGRGLRLADGKFRSIFDLQLMEATGVNMEFVLGLRGA